MTLPTLTTLDGTTSAAEVLGNDEVLANTFGAFDITYNVTEILSPMIIGPVRAHLSGAADSDGLHHILWRAPTSGSQNHDVILKELHVSVLPSTGTPDALIDGSNHVTLELNTDNDADTSDGNTAFLLVINSSASFVKDLGNRQLAEGAYVGVYTKEWTGSPYFHVSMSILAYMRHRTD